eukprot:CAMPEP_0177715768 /NCGR_PEP_ID=MMETSP0484_2-20121128/14167_1 /TAXON_ID=354590 /ORGANISM="Rhodomonas lens, Strain RHODO" /LENGTH=284 /DNA_ID=CAMNT_0019227783 /DNA_START=95 /DNA_END=945 /DNA_ORIENTATION=-
MSSPPVLFSLLLLVLLAVASGDWSSSFSFSRPQPGSLSPPQSSSSLLSQPLGSSSVSRNQGEGAGAERRALRLRGGKEEENILRDIRESIMSAPLLAPGMEGEGVGVSINMTALEAAAERLNISRVVSTAKFGINLPLLFDNFEQEVNFWAIMGLLSFGSGWHQNLPHKYGPEGYPHRDTVTYGLVSLHMGGHSLDASDTAGLQGFALSQAFNVPITKEHRIDGGPIRQDVPSDYKALLDLWTAALNKVGSELMARGFKSLGAFVLSADLHAHGSSSSSSSSSS